MGNIILSNPTWDRIVHLHFPLQQLSLLVYHSLPSLSHETPLAPLASMATSHLRPRQRAIPGSLDGYPLQPYAPFCAMSGLRSLYGLELSCSSKGDTIGMLTMTTTSACWAENTPYLTSGLVHAQQMRRV